MPKHLTLDDARALAEQIARDRLTPLLQRPGQAVLQDAFAEGDFCWFFFRNREIIVPLSQGLRYGDAYAISHDGEARLIADFQDDPDRLADYLKTMSDYFRRRIELEAERDRNFTGFHNLKRAGTTAEDACAYAASQKKDFFYQIRMLRTVYGLDLAAARDMAARIRSEG